MINKILKISFLGILVCSISYGKPAKSADSSRQSPTSDPNETVLKYEEFLRDETKLHGEYSQEYYETILKLLSGVVIIAGGIFTWFNWKSKEDIRKQVNEQFKEKIQGIIAEKLSEIDDIIKSGKEQSAKQFESINKIILELSAMSNRLDIGNERGINIKEQEKNDVNKLKGKRILWVDDYPGNNDYPIQVLEEAGIKFTLAISTEDAMNSLKIQKFDLIISDMGRGANRSAGLDLLKLIKTNNIDTPVVIYCAPKAIEVYGNEALKLGATAIVTGHSRILNIVQKLLL